jgi:hypothetical protein
MQATEKGFLEVVQWLLQRGVKIDSKNKVSCWHSLDGVQLTHFNLFIILERKNSIDVWL